MSLRMLRTIAEIYLDATVIFVQQLDCHDEPISGLVAPAGIT